MSAKKIILAQQKTHYSRDLPFTVKTSDIQEKKKAKGP